MTTSMVLLGLVAVWGAYLAVWWRDNRGKVRRSPDMIDSFSRQLGTLRDSTRIGGSVLGSPNGLRPRSLDEAARRRRMILALLGGLAAVTFLLGFVVGAPAFLANVVIDTTLGTYGYAVIRRRNIAAEREMKVTMLRAVPAPVGFEERRTVNA